MHIPNKHIFNKLGSTITSLFLLYFLLSTMGCQEKTEEHQSYHFKLECEASPTKAELKNKSHSHAISDDESLTVEMGGFLSSNEFHSAPSSMLITGKHAYSFVTQINNIQLDEYFVVSIWRKDPSRRSGLVVRGEPASVFYLGKAPIIEKGENGWEKIQLTFEVPPVITYLKLFAYLSDSDSAYFDDLSIERFPKKEYPSYSNEAQLRFYFTDEEMQKFEEERIVAFKEGVHFSSGDWRKGILSDESDVLPIKARLKGDWLDHLQGRKWSLRLKMRGDNTFKRMRTFSVQTPESRYFLHEYLSHKLFAQEGILTTRYDFAPVSLNKNSLGYYAIEEHFAKQLVEYNLRREGPILKLDEDPFWRNMALSYGLNKIKGGHVMPHYETSRVLPFGSGKITGSPTLLSQFNIAHSLIHQYKERTTPVSELFDLDKLAKYLAITDLINGKHGASWHNQRFYYNPVICKLEPINYDNFTEHYQLADAAIPEALEIKSELHDTPGKVLYAFVFSSPELLKLYYENLIKYTDDDFIMKFYKGQESAIQQRLPLIQEEFPEYHIDSTFLLNNAKLLRQYLPELKSKIQNGFFEQVKISTVAAKATKLNQVSILTSYLNAYYAKKKDLSADQTGKAEILIENYNGVPIELVGLSDPDNKLLYRFPPNIKLEGFKDSYDSTTLQVPFLDKAVNLAFKTLDTNRIIYSELTPWEKNTDQSPYQELMLAESSNATQLFKERNDSLLLQAGKYSLSEKLLIPSGKKIIIEAGVEIDMIKEASIISYSPVYFNGTESNPIRIVSTDYTANGIVVLQAAQRSEVNYTTFSGLNTLNYKGWVLTGAVNFYESDVVIKNSSFENNQCEDALNIIRSDFWVSNSSFIDIYADAFDSDFCTGLLDNSSFTKVGNDAIDFSTSQIKIRNCDINGIDDKGISGGEASTLTVENCRISNCNIGVASKDLSLVSIEKSSIKDCNYGFVALKKKPEYGGATIEAISIELENCVTDDLIEKASVLNLNGRKIVGTQKNVSSLFY